VSTIKFISYYVWVRTIIPEKVAFLLIWLYLVALSDLYAIQYTIAGTLRFILHN